MGAKKRCGKYYKALRQKSFFNNAIKIREEKWYEEFNNRFSVDFWKKYWAFIKEIEYENKIKGLQYNIVRFSLKTNSTVHYFKSYVSPLCTYCGLENEGIPHLFWYCNVVNNFYRDICDFFMLINIDVPFNKNKIIFGIHDKKPDTLSNFIILAMKQYI